METIAGNLYDYPKYYDLVYGSDWQAEFEFLEDCFEKHAELPLEAPVERLFEPACGTGRLLYKFAEAGYQVGGLDLNERAIEFCNARLARRGFDETTFVGDMTDFALAQSVDAAFNTINSFRHLATEKQARDHLECVAAALRPGGLYVLGLHLTPTTIQPMQEESWSGRRGNLAVLSRLWVEHCDLKIRQERVGMSFDVYTPTKQFRILDEISFRTYTAPQMKKLLKGVAALEIAAVYDFAYDVDAEIEIDSETEDVVFILRKPVE